MLIPILIILGLVFLVGAWLISINNRLVALKNRREQAFGDIDVQLKQRFDLIPQLVAAVKGYMEHESETLTKIVQARKGYQEATTVNDKIAAENQMSSAMRGFNIQVEAYPELKANEGFLQLQGEISDIENKLASARRFFNSATTEYNNGIEQFPSSIIAKNKGFVREPMFDLGTEQRTQLETAPTISFN